MAGIRPAQTAQHARQRDAAPTNFFAPGVKKSLAMPETDNNMVTVSNGKGLAHMTHTADATDAAKAAFSARAAALGDAKWQGIAAEAFENAFSVEVFGQYANDLERWQVALATLDMLADERGL